MYVRRGKRLRTGLTIKKTNLMLLKYLNWLERYCEWLGWLRACQEMCTDKPGQWDSAGDIERWVDR